LRDLCLLRPPQRAASTFIISICNRPRWESHAKPVSTA